MKRRQKKLWLTLATSVLLLGNLSIAAPAFADTTTTTNQQPQQTTVVSQQKQAANTVSSSSPANTASSAADQQPSSSSNTNDDSQVAAKVDNQTATSIAQQVKSGQLDDQQVIDHTYQHINQENGKLNNVIYQDPTNAHQQVQKLEQGSKTNKPFYGVPILIKGLGQAYKGYPNTNGLPFLVGNKYGYTKNFVQKLQDMGFIIIGETNFPELGLINITNSNLNGVAHNPWALGHNTGGSSGGATASVAAGIVPIATGNDAGGSLRIPASWSGVIGLKPTQGIIIGDPISPSVVNFAETRDINDTVTLFKGLMNPARSSMEKPVPANLRSLKIAYSLKSPVGTPVSQDAKNAVLNAVKFLRSQGFTVVQQDSPVDGVKLMQNYYLGALDDGSVANFLAQKVLHRNLTANDVTNNVVSPMTYALYEASRKAPNNVSKQFSAELALVNSQMTAFHNQYPIYLTPTTATVAPLNSDPAFLPEYVQKMMQIKNLPFNQQMQLIYDSWLHGLSKTPFTQLANLSGDPALSLPTYVSAAGLPLGIQLEGFKGSDLILLALGKIFEENHQLQFLNTYRAQQNQKGNKPSNHQTGTQTSPTQPIIVQPIHNQNGQTIIVRNVQSATTPSNTTITVSGSKNGVLTSVNGNTSVAGTRATSTTSPINTKANAAITSHANVQPTNNQQKLPQTGNNSLVALALLGSTLLGAIGMMAIDQKRKMN